MGTHVMTETYCDRCGDQHREEGAHGSVPPVGWAHATVSVRRPGEGWSGGSQRKEGVLCPSCITAVDAVTFPREWVPCSPELIAAGVDCATTPRRPVGTDRSHDHLVLRGTVKKQRRFSYDCVNGKGEKTLQDVDAVGPDEAIDLLKQRGFMPLSCKKDVPVLEASSAAPTTEPLRRNAAPTTIGVELIRKERERQLQEWSLEHDKEHPYDTLAIAAAHLLVQGHDSSVDIEEDLDCDQWVHDLAQKHYDDRKRRLMIAGAFVAAELDRLG